MAHESNTFYPLDLDPAAKLRGERDLVFFFLLIIREVRSYAFLKFQLYGDMAQRMQNYRRHWFANYSYFLFRAVLRLF
jgi:hypothetical protein